MFVFKVIAYLYTGSAVMLSEAVHSLADMLNQVTFDLLPVNNCLCIPIMYMLTRQNRAVICSIAF